MGSMNDLYCGKTKAGRHIIFVIVLTMNNSIKKSYFGCICHHTEDSHTLKRKSTATKKLSS